MRSVFRRALQFDECTFVSPEVISQNYRRFKHIQGVAAEKLIVDIRRRKNNLVGLNVKSDRQVAPLKTRSTEYSVFLSMIGRIVRQSNLSASHQARTP